MMGRLHRDRAGGTMSSALWLTLGLSLAVTPACTCRRTPRFARGDAAAVVLVQRTQDAGGVAANPEIEPNDSPTAPQELKWTGAPPAVSVAGRLDRAEAGKPGDVDVFRVTIPGTRSPQRPDATLATAQESKRLAIEVTAEPGLALSLDLLDENLLVMKSLTAGAGEPVGLPNLAVKPGFTYSMRLKRAPVPPSKARPDAGTNEGAGYRLTALLLDFEPADEREPNDRMETANDLVWQGPSALAAGLFGWRRDEDWYRLPLDTIEPGRVLNLELEGVEGVTASLSVHDSAGKRVVGVRGRKGEKLTLRNLALPGRAGDAGAPTGARAWYAVVRTEAGVDVEHRYVLRVETALPGQGNFEAEPNDDPAHASPLADGTTGGYLTVGDVDIFRYQTPASCELDVQVTGPARVKVKLDILSANGSQVLASATAPKPRQTAEIQGFPCPSEPILIRLSQGKYDGNASEPYSLTVTSRPATARPAGRD